MSGFRNGNVGGGADDAGGCCRNVGIVRFGRETVERNVASVRHCIPILSLIFILRFIVTRPEELFGLNIIVIRRCGVFPNSPK
jgi:hypothetical protein